MLSPPSQLEWALFDLAFSCARVLWVRASRERATNKFSFEDSSAMRLLPLITGTETAGPLGRSGKQSERCVISSFQIAESMGFRGDFREWEDLLRIGD
jgi:hypothetical protein